MENKIKLTKDIEIYKKLLEKAKKAYSKCATNAEKRRLESIFPELKESEDENIRRCISDVVRKYGVEFTTGFITKEKMLAWLEKQGKQADYNPYKATIKSIADMVEWYANNGDFKIFYEYIKVKCKEAVEYDKTYLEKQGKQKETTCDKCRKEQPSHSCQDITELGRCYFNTKRQDEKSNTMLQPHKGDSDNPYDMSFEEAQKYASERGIDTPINDGDVFVDERYITQTIGNILHWADEHPKHSINTLE